MISLFIHTEYSQTGGEEIVFSKECLLLSAYNIQNFTYTLLNKALFTHNDIMKALCTIWNQKSFRDIHKLVHTQNINVSHCHNTFPMISPSVYFAANRSGSCVVQTLHNYRLLCPNAIFLRNNKPCELCKLMFFAWPGVKYHCYRNSLSATLVTALMLSFHKLIGTWKNQVDVYIALTEFARQKFIEGGLPAEKIVVKPNFIDPDPGVKTINGDYALFVGRLSPEKGVTSLLKAWKYLADIPLLIAGDGPLLGSIKLAADKIPSIKMAGRIEHKAVIESMKKAKFLVFPSEWYEGMPMTILEAFACGLPVISSRLGAMAELVKDGETGLLFEAGNPQDLSNKVRWAWEHPQELALMSKNARAEYEAKYTAEKNFEQLMAIYQKAIETRQTRSNGKHRNGLLSRI